MPINQLGGTPIKWYNQFSYDDYDADQLIYVYDRVKFESGLIMNL